MPTRRLQFPENLTVTKLPIATDAEPVEIEVPAGDSHFHVNQSGNYVFNIRHTGSQVLVTGLVEAGNDDAPELTTTVVHHVPNTKAETVVRTLSQGTAAPRYKGLIRIATGANKSESYLNHHSLLLGEKAKSWTLPSLEILADDVKCSHAATLRSITDLDLFYLRSRGLEPESAKELLIEAFISDVA